MARGTKKEKDFKHLNRAELVEIIYQLQLDNQNLSEENAQLTEKLNSKEIKIAEAGSLADAAVSLSEIFFKAQEVADHYLMEVRRNNAELEQRCNAKLGQAQSQADAILRDAELRARLMTEAAEQESARKLAEAEEETARKWRDVNDRVTQLISSRDALKELLQK